MVDAAGIAQPLTHLALHAGKLTFSGAVYPIEGPTSKALGRRLAKSGAIKSWAVNFTGAEVKVRPAALAGPA